MQGEQQPEPEFKVAKCPCGTPALDAIFRGVVRVKCGGCKKRVWVTSDGETVMVWTTDEAPARLAA